MVRIPVVHRFRFSLRTFFVTLFVLSLFGSNAYVSWKWHEARQEIERLREELGYLTIEDPTRFYVREAPTHRWREWRWRICVPSDAVYCIANREIPASGVTRAEHIHCHGLRRGEQRLEFLALRAENLVKANYRSSAMGLTVP